MKIAVTGSSGLIGSALVEALRADGADVVRLVRGAPHGPEDRSWDPGAGRLDPDAVADCDAVVHLAGAGIADRRWTAAYKDEVLRSRVVGTEAVARALADAQRQGAGHRVLLSASAVGYYGDTGDRLTDESGPSGQGFLADLVRRWEAATAAAEQAGVRVAHLRTGIVLSGRGGALRKQARAAKAFAGAPLGSGRQYVPWISLHDEVAAIRHLLGADVAGPVNLVGPAPVTNADFTRVLNRVVRRPTPPVHVPAAVLRIVLGEFADEGVLVGQRLAPTVLQRSGFAFAHRDLKTALRANL
ncbi:MAG: TIGR01777 family oxidoreductase [Actinomycetota bacterium]|nr:TIGR01777 family oxidoreductase [Actinomycetota bacterium]